VLDHDYMRSLGRFDIVYSWGVLHHTDAMWTAMDYAARAVKPGGKLAIAIYTDQGGASHRWRAVKKTYVRAPRFVRFLIVLSVGAFFEIRSALIRLVRLRNPLPVEDWRKLRAERGMSIWHNLVDWVGGYPFEVAKPDQVFDFLKHCGFTLDILRTCGDGHGCNEYVFIKNRDTALSA